MNGFACAEAFVVRLISHRHDFRSIEWLLETSMTSWSHRLIRCVPCPAARVDSVDRLVSMSQLPLFRQLRLVGFRSGKLLEPPMERDARILCCSVQHDCSREGESFLASIIGPNAHRLRQPLSCLTTTDGDLGDLRFCLPRILHSVVFDAGLMHRSFSR